MVVRGGAQGVQMTKTSHDPEHAGDAGLVWGSLLSGFASGSLVQRNCALTFARGLERSNAH